MQRRRSNYSLSIPNAHRHRRRCADAIITVNEEGTFTLNYVPEPIQFGIIETTGSGFDASDRDAKINIRQWPVKGLYLPDAIASYKVGGKTFLITANEGDAREYDAFEEAIRIGDDDKVTLEV